MGVRSWFSTSVIPQKSGDPKKRSVMTKPIIDLYFEQNGKNDFALGVRRNQQRLTSGLKSRYDFIVCRAGTSGCVVAARLAADPNTHVLLLETDGTDETDLVTNPNRWPPTLGTELDWGFIAQPNPNLNGRA
jgi:choline dehydrogenase